jgi:large conductance mechanosensitive channel
MSLIKEFKDFVNRGNVVDLAVAVVLGGAFGKIVTAIVEGLIMAPLNEVLPADASWQTWKAGPFALGPVLAAALNFLIIAFAVFLVVNKLMKSIVKKDAPPPAATPEDILLLREIRDSLKSRP